MAKTEAKSLSKPLAAIDCGTNTFHWLVGSITPNGLISIIEEEKIGVRLGKGGISNGIITPEAWERATNALRHFCQRAEFHRIPSKKINCVATSAVRQAQNGKQFIEKIKEDLGLEIKILDGSQEALTIFNGVKATLPDLNGNVALIMDIGGGSVEFILTDGQNPYWHKSFEIGGQRLMDKFMTQDPQGLEEQEAMFAFIAEQLQPLWQACQHMKPTLLIGSAGTFETITEVIKKRSGLAEASFSTTLLEPIPFEELMLFYEDLLVQNLEQRLKIKGMIPLRADMIVVAVGLLVAVLENTEIETVYASAYALKEGLLLSGKAS